jgi:DNA-binding response OmpR family regulator
MHKGEPSPASSRLVGAKVLVAEDNALIAMDIETNLQEQGCIVLQPTATIADTLASLSHDHPDVALLDLHLLDGLATPIAATLAAMGVPFALLTGDRLDVLEHASLASLPYIVKPWRAGDLEQLVGQLLILPTARVSQTLPAAAAASLPATPA